jgi:serine/threonine protein kinase
VENDVLQLGTMVERYEVLGLLGQGGLARVYRVRHTQLGTIHALKLLSLSREGMSERLLLEGRIQAQLRHPNIVNVSDVVQFEGQPGLVIEFVGGPTLEDWLRTEGPPSIEEALEIFAQIVAAVRAAHQIGVLHRDLKPANVLLEKQASGKFVPKVADFGIAKVAMGISTSREAMSRTQNGVAMGTPGYMAPEQFNDAASADARADVFSLGTILYELLTGAQAFAEASLLDTLNAVAHGKYRPLPELNPHVPQHVADAVQRAVSPDPAHRFPDCEALAEAVLLDRAELLALVVRGAPGMPMSFQSPRSDSAAASLITGARAQDDGPLNNDTLVAPDWEQSQGPLTYLAAPEEDSAALADPDADGAPELAAEAGPDRRPAWALAGLAVALLVGVGIWGMLKPDPMVVAPEPVAAPSVPTAPAPVGAPPVAAPVSDAAAPVAGAGPAAVPVASRAAAVASVAAPVPPPAAEVAAPVAVVQPDVPPVAVVEAPAPEPVAQAAVSQAPAIPEVLGVWLGRWNGRPLTLRVESQSGGAVRARVEVLLGTTPRSWSTSGTFDGKTLKLQGEEGFKMSGTLAGTRFSGMFETTGQKSSSWDAAR